MERRLAAIVAIDMVGYSSRMQTDEVSTLSIVKADRQQVIDPKISQYGGRTIKLMGDGVLMEFPSVVNAVLFSVEIQSAFRSRNAKMPQDEAVCYRAGINIGDVIIEGDDIYGDGVNLAARLEGKAEPGGICVSEAVHREVAKRIELDFDDLGEVNVKNISGPVKALNVVFNEKIENLISPIVMPSSARKSGRRYFPIIAAGIFLVGILSGLAWWQPWTEQIGLGTSQLETALPKKPSIAVLPFRDLGSVDDKSYLADGFTNAIITSLSKFPELFVVSGNSTFTYKDKSPNARDVGRELGVRYVLLGTYQQTAHKIRISAQLVDAGQGEGIWAESFDVDRYEVLEVQDKLTSRTASTLVSVIVDRAKARAIRLTDDDSIEAYDLYLRASKFKLSKSVIDENIADLEQALELEPDFAAAYALLSERYLQLWRLNLSDDRQRTLARMRATAQQALEMDPKDYRVHSVLCTMHLYADKKHELALTECERAVSLNPNDPETQLRLAQVLTFMGRADQGLKWMASAKRLNPFYPPYYDWTSAFVHAMAGNYDQAILESEKALVVYQKSLSIRRIIIFSLVGLGRLDEAKKVAKDLLEIAPDFTLAKLRNAPHQPKAQMERILDSFRKAGIPER